MNVKLIAFGIAKDILKSSQSSLEVSDQPSISEIKDALISKYPAFTELRSLRFAVNEDYQDDDFIVSERDEVVIIPPVSGG